MDYDPLAADYARHRAPYAPVVAALVAALSPGSTVLEIGCGTANHLAMVLDTVAARGIGVDPSAAMLVTARRQLPTGAIARGRAERLPIAAGSVDLAFSVDVIHHVGEVDAYFEEAARVLKPGGRLCTVTDSAATIRGRHVLATYFPATVAAELGRYPPVSWLARAADAAGLRVDPPVTTEQPHVVTEASSYRDKAYSSLHLIPGAEFAAGLARLEQDLAAGPLAGVGRNVLLWATRPRR